jgi:hypothetical protein
MIRYAIGISAASVIISMIITLLVFIVWNQYGVLKARRKQYHRLNPKDFPNISISKYKLSSRIWYINHLLNEMGFTYCGHIPYSGYVAYCLGDIKFSIYLKSLKCTLYWKDSRQSYSMHFQLIHLNDLHSKIDEALTEANVVLNYKPSI